MVATEETNYGAGGMSDLLLELTAVGTERLVRHLFYVSVKSTSFCRS